MALSKQDLADILKEKLCLTNVMAKVAVEAVMQKMVDTLKAGEEVRLHGFGTFKVSERKEHYANNPQGGDKILVPAYKTVTFKCSKALKETVNNQ